MYNLESIENKVALGILESGITIDDQCNITYNSDQGKTWLGKLARELDVSRSAIIKNLDVLFDCRILSQPMTDILELVDDEGKKRYVRTFSITNEYQEKMIGLYKITHTFTKE